MDSGGALWSCHLSQGKQVLGTCSWAGGDKSSGWVEGVVGFQTGGDKSQIDAAGLEHQDVTKVMLCFLRS